MKLFFVNLRVFLVKKYIDINEHVFFERKLKKFYKNNSENKIILDVGANKGQSIDFFLKINSEAIIHAFEPNQELYEKLVKKYKNFDNVFIHHIGISNKTGTQIFHQNILDYTSSFEEININSTETKRKSKILGVQPNQLIKMKYEVKTITLKDFIEEQKLTKIDILKIDTEGHEYACLAGLFDLKPLNCYIDFIQIEKLNNDMYKTNNTHQILKDNNFDTEIEIHHGFGNFDDVIYKNKC